METAIENQRTRESSGESAGDTGYFETKKGQDGGEETEPEGV